MKMKRLGLAAICALWVCGGVGRPSGNRVIGDEPAGAIPG